MSTIERAGERLSSKDSRQDSTSLDADLQAEDIKREGVSEKIIEEVESQLLTTNTKSEVRKHSEKLSTESRPSSSDQKITESSTRKDSNNDISISKLGIEGLLSIDGKRSRQEEEYRLIKRPLLAKSNVKNTSNNLIMVTSSIAGEGKTFTSANLAISMAMEVNKTVLLIDCDLANPTLSRRFEINDSPGLTESLVDENTNIGDFILHTDIPKLSVIPAGMRHNRSTELLASDNMLKLLGEISNRYSDRIILFDSPPLLLTSEASVLAENMGQVVIVIEYAATPQHLIKDAASLISNKNSISLVLNKTRDEFMSRHTGGYGYGYGYGEN